MIKVTVEDKVARLHISPIPSTKRIFLDKIIDELSEIMLHMEKDDSISVVLLTGKVNAFSTGGNLNEFATLTSK